MGYRIRMHSEIRGWLTGLRGSEPELARHVGEAVLALLDAGETLGPPLVVPLETVLRAADDPRETLDYSYQRQLEILTKVRRGVADVATSRKRLELMAGNVEQQLAKLAEQRAKALDAGREDLASEARAREAGLEERLSDLRRQLLILTAEEEKLTAASQRLQAKVDAFRVQKETIKATYTAAEASQRVREAFAEMDAEAGDAELIAEEDTSSTAAGAVAAEDELRQQTGDLTEESHGDSGPGDHDDPPLPPGMMVLRPGAPDDVRAGLLFVVEPQDTAVLLGCAEDRSPDEYRAAARIAAARLPEVKPGGSSRAFVSYTAESFLDEFFPGEETEVEVGANALVARSRAHTLAQARQRMRLTQAQVAERMNVRQERVSAIERAEPGATEIRTLAAYVRALGGRLEITAHIGDERLLLR
jgi:phage shock protein A/DNA-binding XRE family transcriptional regulator